MDRQRSVVRADVLVVDGRIDKVAKSLRPPKGARVIECEGRAVMPGLIQSHVHLCQVLFRNQADGLELLDWLSQRIWPFEAAHDERSLGHSARLGIAELLLGGTTGIVDMATVRHTGAVMQAALDSGIRYTGGKCLMDQGFEGLREDTRAALKETEALGKEWHGQDDGRIRYALCPRFVLSCTKPLWNEVRSLSEKNGWTVHTHASENRAEVAAVRKAVGDDNIAWFHRIGLTGERLVLAHCVHLSEREEEILSATATTVVHCPGANLKLASGLSPVPRLLQKGAHLALGGDGAPCNNTLDAFHEMRLAATLHLPAFGPRALPASEVLAMATRNGARALGIEDQVGSIEAGKRADLAVLELTRPHFVPLGPDLHATIVYCAKSSDVTDTIVDGRHLVRGQKLVSLDAASLAENASAELARLTKRL
ncbi:MAG: 5'-deoxyadenosine deaminase [Deltaproteobacteria bacterium]|nr:5'-deoxyadenosine deaminase [Deltaproteobacteria bacterium]